MMTNVKLSSILKPLAALFPQDITTARTGPYINVSGSQRLLAIALTGAVANTKTVTLGFLQAQDATGTGSKALGTSVVVTSAADNSDLSGVIEAQIGDLDTINGFGFVAVTLLSNNSTAVQAGAVLVLGDNRFNP